MPHDGGSICAAALNGRKLCWNSLGRICLRPALRTGQILDQRATRPLRAKHLKERERTVVI